MDKIPESISQFFISLGLEKEEIEIYWALSRHGNLTILEISRITGISRTQVYRFLERMERAGLTEVVIDEHRLMAKAVEITQLERLVKQRQSQTQELITLFPKIQQILAGQVGQSQAETKVLFYRGEDGIKQMIWNTLRTKEPVVGYTYRMVEDAVGEKFTRDWAEEFSRRGLKGKNIFTDSYLENKKEYLGKPTHLNIIGYAWESRYVPSNILNIDHQMDIYNDVVSFYNWHEGEIFGVEIYNQKVAQFQKQIFNLVWGLAKEVGTKNQNNPTL